MNRKILRLAIPNILSNLSVPLLSSTDAIITGHMDDIAYLGAIAIGTMIFNFIYLGLGFLRMGTTGLTAQSYGRNDEDEAAAVLFRALITAFSLGLILILFQYPIKLLSLYFVNGTPEVESYAASYFDIRIFAAPATLSLYALHGWFLGMQNARYPMYLAVGGNLLNLGFNLFFVYGAGMNSDGVALGTVAAQYSGMAAGFLFLFVTYKKYLQKFKLHVVMNLGKFRQFFSLNFDIFIRTVVVVFAFNYFTIKSAGFGEEILAVNTILMQLWMLLSYGVDGFAYAAESLTGKYIGRNDKENLVKSSKYIFVWGIVTGALFSLAYYLFEKPVLAVFTDQTEIIRIAGEYFGWVVIAPLINNFCFIWDGIFIGATATKAMRNSMIASLLFIFFPLFFITKGFLGNHSLWLAMLGFMAARGLTLTFYARKHVFDKIQVTGE